MHALTPASCQQRQSGPSDHEKCDRDIAGLGKKLKTQKIFMNMVVHDLRNPSESI